MAEAAKPSMTRRYIPGWPDWPAALLSVLIVAAFFWQLHVGLAESWAWGGASRESVLAGRWWVLFTAIFLHGGPIHVTLNTAALLFWGRAVSLRISSGRRATLNDGLIYIGFFLVCGLLSSLCFIVMNGGAGAVGASGAIFGLWGAEALIGNRAIGFRKLTDRDFWREVLGAVVGNVAMLAGGSFLIDGASTIAWEGHLGGFLAGLLLIRPALRLSGRA